MNKVILVGNLTKDPEFTTTSNGVSLCKFTLAVQRRYKAEGQEPETDFIPIIVWRGQAENCNKFLKKGNKAGVVGSIQTRTYDTQDGTKRYVTEVIADEVEFLNSKSTSTDPIKQKIEEEKQQIMSKFEPIDEDNLPF